MAKTAVAATETTAPTPEVKELSAKTRKVIDDIRPLFQGFVAGMDNLLTSRAKLAPKFIAAFKTWQKEVEGGTFVAFVREIDPLMPQAMKEYRNHSTYNAAIYLKRLVDAQERGKGAEKEEREGPQAVPPLAGMARIIAAITPLMSEDNLPKLWAILASEMHWSEAQQTRLEKLVQDAEPAFQVRKPKGGVRPTLMIAAPRHSHTEDATEAVA